MSSVMPAPSPVWITEATGQQPTVRRPSMSILTASGGVGYQVIANMMGLARSWSCEAVGAAAW